MNSLRNTVSTLKNHVRMSEHPGLKAWDCNLGRASHSAKLSDLKDLALKGRVSSLEDEKLENFAYIVRNK